MKQIISLITLIIVAALVSLPCEAQSRALIKARQKEYKNKIKEYSKEGWKVFGTSRSLDVALLTHYEKLNALGDKGYEIVGTATAFKSKNVGHQTAVNNACIMYARKAGSTIKGRIVSDLAQNSDDESAEFDKMYAAYESQVQKEIKGEMIESYSIIHDNNNGTFDMQTFFIVNEDAASQARIRAWEYAMKESEVAQKYANKVSEFIKEGFSVE